MATITLTLDCEQAELIWTLLQNERDATFADDDPLYEGALATLQEIVDTAIEGSN